ncbi:MAG: hypothetical protein K8F24_13245, partial [Bacteroidales bacterium]|nr:hypothetical protein [Bacteroidales bacterium]
YLGGGVASLGFSAGMVNVGNPPVSAAVEFVDGSVRIANGPSEGVLSLPEIYSPANSLVAVPINVVEVEEPVSVISLNLNFDASKLTYVGFTNGQLSSWVVNVNQGNGTIAAYYTNVTAQTINDGSLLSFNFDYTSGEAALAFAPGTAMQTSVDNFLNLELVDGFVNNSMMINALPNNADYGSVTGGGVYDYGTQVSLESICAPGCSFENWTEDGVVVSIEGVYEFIAAAACDLVANFEVNEYEVTLAASPESGGAVEGGGLKAFGSLVTVSATANEGYTFVNWAKGETEVSTDAAYTFTMPAENLDLTANFTANTYSLSLTASPTAGGTLVGAGDKVFGTEVTVTATANDGYTFVRWTKGETEVSTETAYTFSMPAEALALTANFEAIEYALTLVSSPEGAGVHNGSGDYPAGSVVAITAAANPGFQFINWTDGTEVVSGVADFSYTMPIGDATLTANYSPVYSISGKVKYANTTGGVRPINTNGSSTTQVILFESDGTTEITRVNTDINGDYSFEGLAAGDYVVSAETDKPWGGNAAITLVDYAYTKAYVDNGFPLIGLSFNAADINQSKTITLVDYAIIRHYVDTGTKLSPWIAPDWIFQEQEVIISNEDWINFDIKGICSGDVNASYEPTL